MAEKESDKTDKTGQGQPEARDRRPQLFLDLQPSSVSSDGSQVYGTPVDVSWPSVAKGRVVVGRLPQLSEDIGGSQLPELADGIIISMWIEGADLLL